MKELVMNVLNISGQAAIIFVVLLAVRGIFALGRVPKKYAYALWAILFVRLLLPIQMEARWGLMPQESGLARAVENMADASQRQGSSVGGQSIPGVEEAMAEWHDMSGAGSDAQYGQPGDVDLQVRDSTAGEPVSGGKASMTERERSNTDLRHPSLWAVVVGIWITGSVLLAGYGFFSYYRLKRMLRCSIRLEGWGEGIYLADGIGTPFVLGFMTPQIYLPSDMAEQSYLYVITHERIHIRRRDYLFKLGAYLLTCLYWFHPLVWAGFILMGRDMEMSCDEAVLRRMDGDCRGEYADSLLRLSCEKHYPAAAPLAFGEGDTRGRIKHIMGYRKAAAVVVIAAAALTGILAAVLLTSPRKEAAQDIDLSQDSPELTESNPAEDSMGQAEGGAAGQDAETATDNGSQQFSFQVAYRDAVSCPRPAMTGNTSLGADGAILDYADGDKVIFHGYFGLYVYSASTGETIGAVDLQALGCGHTQGDNACQVLVSRDGSKVYFYPMGGIKAEGISDQEHVFCCYVYDMAGDRLRIGTWDLGQPEESPAEIVFSQLMEEELSEYRVAPVAELEQTAGEQGFFSDYGRIFDRDGEEIFGYLRSATGNLEDLVYMQMPVYENNPAATQKSGDGEEPGITESGVEWREAVRLFGADGQGSSIVSYGQGATRITIDGVTFDLCQVMTEYRLGDEMIESPNGNILVNAVAGLQCVEGLWIVEGHMGPKHSTYSFYDPATGEWMCHIVGTCLTWSSRDERVALWEGNSESLLSTVIYALDNKIYSLKDGELAYQIREQAGQDEIIYGLYRQGDEITVEIGSDQTEERRIEQFIYKSSKQGQGFIKLE